MMVGGLVRLLGTFNLKFARRRWLKPWKLEGYGCGKSGEDSAKRTPLKEDLGFVAVFVGETAS